MRTRFVLHVMLFSLLLPALAFAETSDDGLEVGSAGWVLSVRGLDAQGLGVLRGVTVDVDFSSGTVGMIDDAEPGGVVVRLRDAKGRTQAAVSLRADAFDVNDEAGSSLSIPIDSVWGSFDYSADGYWTQRPNQRINGGNCERLVEAEIVIQTEDGAIGPIFVAGPSSGPFTCSDLPG